MAHFAPKPRQKHRMVVELKGPQQQGRYEKYKREMRRVIKKYKARITSMTISRVRKKKA